MKSYTEALAKLVKHGKPCESKKLANNTYLIRGPLDPVHNDPLYVAVKLHDTNVVTYHVDGRIVLQSGGYKTVTTKQRINEFSPIDVWSDHGIWYCGVPLETPYYTVTVIENGKRVEGNPDLHFDGWAEADTAIAKLPEKIRPKSLYHRCLEEVPFKDGITLKNGKLINGGNAEGELKARKRVRDFVARYIAALNKGEIPKPSGGDCWYCSMRTDKNKSLGEAVGDKDHIQDHVRHSYFVPSMIYNAMQARGVGPLWYTVLNAYWKENWELPEAKQWRDRMHFTREASRWLCRYIYARLGFSTTGVAGSSGPHLRAA